MQEEAEERNILHFSFGDCDQNWKETSMPQANVKMTVRKTGVAASIIDIEGEVTAFAEQVLSESYGQASANGTRAIVLNFQGLEYMNSSGIGLLVTILIRAKRQGQRLLACGLNEHYRHIFELTRLNEAIRLYDSEADALAAAKAV
jgi:anti-sigma B factor antagonist